ISPSTDTNGVGEVHTFTITVTALPGTTGLAPTLVSITPSVSPAPTTQSNTCSPVPVFASNVATCTLTINSNAPGTFTANATAVVSYPGLSPNISRTTDSSQTTTCCGGSGQFNSGSAVKIYVDGTLKWLKKDNHGNLITVAG